jgi:hypothetical protein
MDDLSVAAPTPSPPSDDRSGRRAARQTRRRQVPKRDEPAKDAEGTQTETQPPGDEHSLDLLA